LGDACSEFLDFYRPPTGKKQKTYRAYRVALEQFQESCPNRYLEQIDRSDLQRLTAFLTSQKGHEPRTARNKLAIVAQFLKANNVPGLLKKGDWPSYVEREPEVYEPEELEGISPSDWQWIAAPLPGSFGPTRSALPADAQAHRLDGRAQLRETKASADKGRTASTGSCTHFGRPTRPCRLQQACAVYAALQ
jgi:hypothetical protein